MNKLVGSLDPYCTMLRILCMDRSPISVRNLIMYLKCVCLFILELGKTQKMTIQGILLEILHISNQVLVQESKIDSRKILSLSMLLQRKLALYICWIFLDNHLLCWMKLKVQRKLFWVGWPGSFILHVCWFFLLFSVSGADPSKVTRWKVCFNSPKRPRADMLVCWDVGTVMHQRFLAQDILIPHQPTS